MEKYQDAQSALSMMKNPYKFSFLAIQLTPFPYVMKEYANSRSNASEQYVGCMLCSARNVIECAFGRLKARFSALRRDIDINLDDLPSVIYSCFSDENKDLVSEEQVRVVVGDEQTLQP